MTKTRGFERVDVGETQQTPAEKKGTIERWIIPSREHPNKGPSSPAPGGKINKMGPSGRKMRVWKSQERG